MNGNKGKNLFTQEEMDNFMALGRALKKVAIRKATEGQPEGLQANKNKNNKQ